MMRKPLLVANWKMNGDVALLKAMQQALLTQEFHGVDRVICPPFVLLPEAKNLFNGKSIAYGAQDVSDHSNGAYTGQISANMLSQLACGYVIIGHSERRQYCFETDTVIAAKCQQAIAAGITPILCVGENIMQKQQGATKSVVLQQVKAVLEVLASDVSKLVIAYEPIWAIGSGQAADPILANEVHEWIRSGVMEYNSIVAEQIRILYGGSANAENIEAFLLQPHIDGALIGGASLKPDVFKQMIATANQINK